MLLPCEAPQHRHLRSLDRWRPSPTQPVSITSPVLSAVILSDRIMCVSVQQCADCHDPGEHDLLHLSGTWTTLRTSISHRTPRVFLDGGEWLNYLSYDWTDAPTIPMACGCLLEENGWMLKSKKGQYWGFLFWWDCVQQCAGCHDQGERRLAVHHQVREQHCEQVYHIILI